MAVHRLGSSTKSTGSGRAREPNSWLLFGTSDNKVKQISLNPPSSQASQLTYGLLVEINKRLVSFIVKYSKNRFLS